MANYHFNVSAISRGKGRSVTKLANYITGERLYDSYRDETFYRKRTDVLFSSVYLPDHAPPSFRDLQSLCCQIEEAERRYDARTAREFKCSLPNELPLDELIKIVDSFVGKNFVNYGLCAVAGIHEGRNIEDPSRNNPHTHIIVPTRIVTPTGFSKKKYREHDKREYIETWREQWALEQNYAYERNGLSIRVSHESLEVQGVRDRLPVPHLSRIDWQREQQGERTLAGDQRRDIQAHNREITQRQHDQDYSIEMELFW